MQSQKGNLKIHLKPKERIYINGAFIGVDRRVTIELLNEMCFLLESHVLRRDDARTPMRQLYYVIQSMIMEPESKELALQVYHAQHRDIIMQCKNQDMLVGVVDVRQLVEEGRYYEALKRIRILFEIEAATLIGSREAAELTDVA